MRDIEPAGGCQYHSLKSTRRWLSYLVTVRPTQNLSRRLSPAVFKAEIKQSGERVAARFACGAESLAVYRAVYKCIASRCRRRATTSYEGKISTATCTSDYVNLLACWSRYFPESVPDGYIGVGYSLFYYLLLTPYLGEILDMHPEVGNKYDRYAVVVIAQQAPYWRLNSWTRTDRVVRALLQVFKE